MPAVLPGTDSVVEAQTRTSNKCHVERQGHVTGLMTLAQWFVGTVARSAKKKKKTKVTSIMQWTVVLTLAFLSVAQ